MKDSKLKNNYVKIPVLGVVFFCTLLAASAFFSGISWAKLRSTNSVDISKATAVFTPVKSEKPELKFFVMSFCPYGNQMEDILRPVYDQLQDKALLSPHYIFDKIDNLNTYCSARSGDSNQCASYVTNGYFSDIASCKKTISESLSSCLNDKQYLKTSSGTMYASLHGRQEANQNVREMCAWKQVDDDKSKWWNFIGNVNKNCTKDNADACWESQAQQAGLDTTKITECFNNEAVTLIENEIALTTKYNVSGSPTVLINDVEFPPEKAYTQNSDGTLAIGKKLATQAKYRTPNVIKEAICISMNKTAKECSTVLNELTGEVPSAGGCGN